MISIIADTLSCISPEEAKKLGIALLPQIVIFGESSFRDDTEINAVQFLDKARVSRVFPSTAAPAPVLYHPIFREIADKKDTALVICPSAKVSGTFHSVEEAANEFPGADIRIVDTQLLAAGLGTVVEYALKCLQKGLRVDEIIAKVMKLSQKNRTLVLVDTLDFLKRGGRIGAASAFIGGLLDMKPILTFRNGQIEPVEKQRTKKKALARIKEMILADCARNSSANLVIMHGDAIQEAETLAAELKSDLGIKDVKIMFPPPAILVHSGPGVLAISYFTE
jgi:DegV family protein with EDD domain